MSLALLIVIVAIISSVCVPMTQVQANTKKNYVLYLSSYSYSWETASLQIAGVQEALSDECVINYEFMDTKNVSYSDDYKEFYDLLKFKLSKRPKYDGIVVADDAALKFVQKYKDELFPNVPIAFTGIDNVDNAKEAAKDEYVSGVVEKADYKKSIEIAKKLLPKATKVVFINDKKENGIGIQKQLQQSKNFFCEFKVSYLISTDYTKSEFQQKLKKIGDDTIVFINSLGQGKDGVVYTKDERVDILANNVKVPMFRISSQNFDDIYLGGYVVDHKQCAYIAGKMIHDALNGYSMADKKLIENTPLVYCFNQEKMNQYDIPMSLLPQNTIIKNPVPMVLIFDECHRSQFGDMHEKITKVTLQRDDEVNGI